MQLTITPEQLAHTEARLKVSLTTGCYSPCFIKELATIEWHRIFDVTALLHEITILEGKKEHSRTKKPTQFRGGVLKGLWHKHFTDARFMVRNVGNYWGIENGQFSSPNSRQYNKFSQMYEKICKQGESFEGEQQDAFMARQVTEMFFTDSFQHQLSHNKLTGEWIVYIPINGVNHYLTIGFHNENDTEIKKRIKPYIDGTPILKKSLDW